MKMPKYTNGIGRINVRPCPVCDSAMACYNTAAISGENQSRTHYLVACQNCGHGPARAYITEREAIAHWNNSAHEQQPARQFAEAHSV